MKHLKDRELYEQYLKEHITQYSVTEFLGRGKFTKTYFNLNEGFKAQQYADKLKSQGAQVILYGVSLPPDRDVPISVTL